MNHTKIDWCDSTWNPLTGCNHGCEYCYARAIAHRFGKQIPDSKCGERGAKTTNWTDADAVMGWWLKRLKNSGHESQIEIEYEEDEDE